MKMIWVWNNHTFDRNLQATEKQTRLGSNRVSILQAENLAKEQKNKTLYMISLENKYWTLDQELRMNLRQIELETAKFEGINWLIVDKQIQQINAIILINDGASKILINRK